MAISVISDIHIKKSDDDKMLFFEKFAANELVLNSEIIVFLGDVFDLMVGSYREYIEKYPQFFEFIEKCIRHKKRIHFIEGNHDFHLNQLFEQFLKERNLDSDLFKYHKNSFQLSYRGIRYHFSHGDDIEIGNYGYKVYKNFITSRFIRLLTENLVTFNIVEYIGSRASKASRSRNRKRYSNNPNDEFIRDKFRMSADKARRKFDVDVFVCGHSHVKDKFSGNNFLYINNGYAASSSSFIYIDKEVGFKDI